MTFLIEVLLEGPKNIDSPSHSLLQEIPDGITGPVVVASRSSGCVYFAVLAPLSGLELTRRRQRTRVTWRLLSGTPACGSGLRKDHGTVSLGKGTCLGDAVLNFMDIIEYSSRMSECEKETSLAQLSAKGRKHTLGSRQPFLCL